jgi:hypothetical protein
MHVGHATFPAVRSYLYGFHAGCTLAGIGYEWEHYFAAAQERGWDPQGNIGIERDFIRKGLSDEEMVREYVAVEIAAYRRAFQDVIGQGKANERESKE